MRIAAHSKVEEKYQMKRKEKEANKRVPDFLRLTETSLHIQPLFLPHFCHSAMIDLFSSKLLLLFPLYLKHCCQRTLSKVSASSRSCCDPLNNPPADLPSEQDEV
ncbi:hypothetical protein U0070_020498 [Myodes glareolus]|uniref:Uncharacterized protein n=1 Tax=Myodes glareolus TaxID=447135 RepID=A0AAW0JBA8_MYOGA